MGTQVKPVVKTSTMEQELQDEVIAVAQVAMSTETNEQEIAAKPQRPASPLLDPVPSNRLTENCDVTSFGLPSEFDQLFSGEDVSMLSLLDHDDLMSEIEAALPDNFQDNPEDDDSAGSESDPSADAVEEEEKEEQQKAPPTIIEEPPATEAEPTELAISILSRNRTPRVSRHLSEPRFCCVLTCVVKFLVRLEAIVLKRTSSQSEPAPASAVVVRTKANKPLVPKPAPTLAPIRKETPTLRILVCQNIPYDRNREIAAMHLHAVQRRSKIRRNVRHATLEVDES
ncbi:hypothetical protein AM587_10013321 [Phytophthora nicotianae]|uniref:Uncharacterized protein n=1 Tax=Phytophthora nicotianae TaxID=4792 RepID=A0A0W8BZV1_PHYNI|nr:hypothetical protein AM587_10013321 [Phytophthora nicotianae]